MPAAATDSRCKILEFNKRKVNAVRAHFARSAWQLCRALLPRYFRSTRPSACSSTVRERAKDFGSAARQTMKHGRSVLKIMKIKPPRSAEPAPQPASALLYIKCSYNILLLIFMVTERMDFVLCRQQPATRPYLTVFRARRAEIYVFASI